MLAWPAALLLGCHAEQAVAQQQGATLRDPAINTAVFECTKPGGEQFELTIRRGPGELALWLPWEFDRPYLVLSQIAEQGKMTSDFREGDVLLRFDGDRVDLTVGAEHFDGCTENPVRSVWEHAKLAGVDFRAVGTKPDWYVEIRRGATILFQAGDNGAHVAVPTPEPGTDAAERAVYRAAGNGHDLVVEIGGAACPAPDGIDMSGTAVVVTLDGEVYSGCGRPLH